MDASYEAITAAVRTIAPQIRASMTPNEVQEAADEGWNVYLALDVDDPDVLFALSNRAIAAGATDFDLFTLGYAHGLSDIPPDGNGRDYRKGYEAGSVMRPVSAARSVAD